ncbi:MAG: glycosyltransferase [Bacteroidota bacterium]
MKPPTPVRKVLIAPLDWGLGHAARCLPVAKALHSRGVEVAFAGAGSSLALLKKEWPGARCFEIAPYGARYARRWPLMWMVFWQMPRFVFSIWKEHRQIEKLCRVENFQLVISDNRYGAWSAHVPSVFITHQLNIIMPPVLKWLEPVVRYFNHQQIQKFRHCWVPDSASQTLTGLLTNPAKLTVTFVGTLSRMEKQPAEGKVYDVVAILSGPEPQRTVFEELLRTQLVASGLKYLMILGKPQEDADPSSRPHEKAHLQATELARVIEQAKLVICRSGYSTIMDLAALRARVFFVPTPGQTEQEYLARRLQQQGMAGFASQKTFRLTAALAESNRYTGFANWSAPSNLLCQAIDEILHELLD